MLEGTPEDVVRRYEALPELAATTDFGTLDRNVVVLDTETTGLSYNHDELIQIAAARLECGEIVDWFVTFVDPGKELPEEIEHLTGIHESDLAGAPSPDEALARLVEFAGDALIVAHNAGFDRTFVTKHPAGYPLLENTWIDSLDLSRIALARLRSHRLIDLVRAFDAPASTHRADDDVAATCVVYRILLAAVLSMPARLVRAIADMAPLSEWSTGFVFQQCATLLEEQEKTPDEVDESIQSTQYIEGAGLPAMEGPAPAAQEPATAAEAPAPVAQTPAPDTKTLPTRQLFSLREMRRARIVSLPVRSARKDADELAGQLVFPTPQDIERAFSAQGALGSIYPDFEPRDEQRAMAKAIRDAFESSENLVVEAGTGVGKSMAYLVPAALTARANGITVGVATKTNSLLDQLVYQELPALASALNHDTNVSRETSGAPELPAGGASDSQQEQPASNTPVSQQGQPASNTPVSQQGQPAPLTWAPLKGMAHYPCLRKVSRLVDNGPGMREVAGAMVSQAPALAALLSYIEQSEFDDMDSLKIDYRTLPRRQITTTSTECLRRKCPFFGKLCFVHGARRRAEQADIIVTNHTLLFCDIAADGGLLPTVRHWIVDEAHATEEEARGAFAATIDSEALLRLAGRLSESAGARNVFARAEKSMSAANGELITQFFALSSKAKAAGAAFAQQADDYATRCKDLLYFDPVSRTKRGQSYEQVDVWINAEVRSTERFRDVAASAAQLIETTDKLIKASQDLVAYLEGIDEAVLAQREIASIAFELREVRNAAELIFIAAPENYAYQATLFKKKERRADRLQALLLDVGDLLNESFFARTHTVAFTSATLSVGGKFDSFEQAVGLNRTEFSTAKELQLDSSYDFDNNMIVYVVKDMPEPNDAGYPDALNRLLVETHRAQRGSMLTLFTNRREMERSFDVVSSQLKADDLRVVCQKWGVSVKGLRDEFLADEHLSLFALKSFWEGFDAPGATLKGVIIPKLPFARPTDPLYCERASRDDRAWWRYVLPQAVIETKQAAGRLIRKADDHGVLILADKRLITKSYGKTFLGSLQSRTVRVCTLDEVVAALRMMGAW